MVSFVNIRQVGDGFGVNFQQIADDLCTSAAKLCVLSSMYSQMTSEELSSFNKFVDFIKKEGEWEGSYDDQTDYYEWNGIHVVVWADMLNSAIIVEKTSRNYILNLLG